ncbi:MAG: hypothetical protein K0R51_1398 [Cytophagaceae bacterium]|jgi:hypothetical protein|nr:hypothetical protein [Cytophagaceae bacterium]
MVSFVKLILKVMIYFFSITLVLMLTIVTFELIDKYWHPGTKGMNTSDYKRAAFLIAINIAMVWGAVKIYRWVKNRDAVETIIK